MEKFSKIRRKNSIPASSTRPLPPANNTRHPDDDVTIITDLKRKVLEAQYFNAEVQVAPRLLTYERKKELFRILQDVVFDGENFSQPFLHLYEGKLKEASAIQSYTNVSYHYQHAICERLRIFITLQPYEVISFLTNTTIHSLFRLLASEYNPTRLAVRTTLLLVYERLHSLREDLLDVAQNVMIDYNAGLAPPNGLDKLLSFLHAAFEIDFIDFEDVLPQFYEKVVLILLKNLRPDFTDALKDFICIFLEVFYEYWGVTLRCLFKYWAKAGREKAGIYVRVFQMLIMAIPGPALAEHSTSMFTDLEKVLKYSKAVDFVTRAELMQEVCLRKIIPYVEADFPWICDYLGGPSSILAVSSLTITD